MLSQTRSCFVSTGCCNNFPRGSGPIRLFFFCIFVFVFSISCFFFFFFCCFLLPKKKFFPVGRARSYPSQAKPNATLVVSVSHFRYNLPSDVAI